MINRWLIVSLVLGSLVLIFGQEIKAEQVVISYKVSQGPVVDGYTTEDVWKNVEPLKTFDQIAQLEIQIKSVYDDSTLYFLVSFPDKDESRQHRNWIWDKEKEIYEEGPKREDVFVFKWKLNDKTKDLSLSSDESYEADIWYWKARRTDPQGFADDKFQLLANYSTKGSYEVTSKTGNTMYLTRKGDAGSSSYKTKIFVDYEGDIIERYEIRQPQSSRADVKAKGAWSDGRWTIEFSRALVTGNNDDINFHSLKKSYGFGVSRYEIAGRPPENSDQPLFGSGDISEMLALKFQ